MKGLKWLTAAASAAALALGVPAIAQDKKAEGLAKQDRQALQRMALADMAEIEAGKVAAQKASNPEVKKFAEHMVKEHSQMLDEGGKLAQSKGVKPPAAPDKKHQNALEKLQGLSGDEFDRRYMRQMVRDHEDALKLADKTAKAAKDPELKAHAEKGAPHIKEHLAMARRINSSLREVKK
jgi:putative membrane protein